MTTTSLMADPVEPSRNVSVLPQNAFITDRTVVWRELPIFSPERKVAVALESRNAIPVIDAPDWFRRAIGKIYRLGGLPHNWDGYRSDPVKERELGLAISLLESISPYELPVPSVVPISGGGIQFEWQVRKRELEVVLIPDSDIISYLKVYEDGTLEEGNYTFPYEKRTRYLVLWLLRSNKIE